MLRCAALCRVSEKPVCEYLPPEMMHHDAGLPVAVLSSYDTLLNLSPPPPLAALLHH